MKVHVCAALMLVCGTTACFQEAPIVTSGAGSDDSAPADELPDQVGPTDETSSSTSMGADDPVEVTDSTTGEEWDDWGDTVELEGSSTTTDDGLGSSGGEVSCTTDCEPALPPENLDNPLSVRVHGDFVYFTEAGSPGQANGSVRRFRASDPTDVQNVAMGVNGPRTLVFSGDDVFFYESSSPAGAVLWQAPLEGPPTAKASVLDGLSISNGPDPAYGLAYASPNDSVHLFDGYSLRRLPTEGTVGLTATSHGLIADDTHLYFVYGGVAYRLPLDYDPLEVSISQPGEPLETLDDGHNARAAQQDDDFIYWSTESTFGQGTIIRVAKDGSGSDVLAADVDPTIDSAQVFAYDLALDERHIYYVTTDYSNRLMRAPLREGAEPEPLAETQAPNGVALDERYVYFTDRTAIRRLPKL